MSPLPLLSSPLLETQQYTNIHVSLLGYRDLEEKREVMEAMGVATTTFNHVTNVSSNVREGGEERERERGWFRFAVSTSRRGDSPNEAGSKWIFTSWINAGRVELVCF